MAQQIGQVLQIRSPSTDSPASYETSEAERLLAEPLTTKADCERVRQLALSLPTKAEPATPKDIAQKLEYIAATLPYKNVDEVSGKMRFTVYVQLLRSYSNAALSYMVERVCRERDWFPTPRQCIEILKDYRPSLSDREQVLVRVSKREEQIFDQFLKALGAGPVDQSYIDLQPERWKRIAVEKGYLRYTENGIIQREAAHRR